MATTHNPSHADGANTGWTTGFWTGMLWMAHELSGKAEFRTAKHDRRPLGQFVRR